MSGGDTSSSADVTDDDYEPRVCILTGAGGTLGRAFCRLYAPYYEIVAVCRHRSPGVPTQYERYVDPMSPDDDLTENRSDVFMLQADLEKPGQVERVVEVALARFGRVDLVVNNAVHSRWHPPGLVDTEGTMADFDRHFAMNVGVPARLSARMMQEAWMHTADDNRAANRNIVNVSSIAGSKVFPGQGQAVYAASKAALNQLTRHQASEYERYGVRVNAIAPNSFPGAVTTEEVAASIVRLDQESVSGRILVLDAPPSESA